MQVYNQAYDWPSDLPYYSGGIGKNLDLKNGENSTLIDFVLFDVAFKGYYGMVHSEVQGKVDNGIFKVQHSGQCQANILCYGSATDNWVDVYLMRNDEIVAETHGIGLDMNGPTVFPNPPFLGSNGVVLELEKGDTLRVVSDQMDMLDYVQFNVQYSTPEKNSTDEAFFTYTAEQSGYHGIRWDFYLSMSGVWVETYAKKNGEILPDSQSFSTYVYVYDNEEHDESYYGYGYLGIVLDQGDIVSLHCDTPHALDSFYVVLDKPTDTTGNYIPR